MIVVMQLAMEEVYPQDLFKGHTRRDTSLRAVSANVTCHAAKAREGCESSRYDHRSDLDPETRAL